jgi:hypothetical protein
MKGQPLIRIYLDSDTQIANVEQILTALTMLTLRLLKPNRSASVGGILKTNSTKKTPANTTRPTLVQPSWKGQCSKARESSQ